MWSKFVLHWKYCLKKYTESSFFLELPIYTKKFENSFQFILSFESKSISSNNSESNFKSNLGRFFIFGCHDNKCLFKIQIKISFVIVPKCSLK